MPQTRQKEGRPVTLVGSGREGLSPSSGRVYLHAGYLLHPRNGPRFDGPGMRMKFPFPGTVPCMPSMV